MRSDRITAIVATYGSDDWRVTAERALGSLDSQTLKPKETIVHHGRTLAEARNNAARAASTDYLLFVDADDLVDQHYVKAMDDAISATLACPCLFQPATRGLHPDGHLDDEPVLLQPTRLIDRNYLVIGTVMPRDRFLGVGGFDEYEWCEDWELFIRLTLAGAVVQPVPEAVYIVSVSDGRNSDRAAAGRCYREIRARHREAWAEHERRLAVTPPAQAH